MTKAEEIAITECSGILYQDTLRAVNLALEWAAEQCEEEGRRLITQRDSDAIDGYVRTVLNVRASHIRAGKSQS